LVFLVVFWAAFWVPPCLVSCARLKHLSPARAAQRDTSGRVTGERAPVKEALYKLTEVSVELEFRVQSGGSRVKDLEF